MAESKKNQLNNWKFHYGEIKRWNKIDHDVCYNVSKAGGAMGKTEVWMDENEWISVTLPHDWCSVLPVSQDNTPSNGYKERGVGWYYTTFESGAVEDSERILLHFEGVSSQCTLYANGCVVSRNFSGYTGFICDVTNYITEGENIISLRVDNLEWEGWWYEGAGIYRPVTLYRYNVGYIKPNETFVKPVFTEGEWVVDISYCVCGLDKHDFSTDVLIEDADGKIIAKGGVEFSAERGAEIRKKITFSISTPNLWSPETPYLYKAKISLKTEDNILDTEEILFGFRYIQWEPKVGMILNGSPYRIKGICCHQDHGGVGYALSETLLDYRVRKLKNMGCNAIRCAHHNPSAAFLSTCDREGIMVMSENRNFNSSIEVKEQVSYMVKNSRNHPSVFIYSLFNEEPWQAEIRGKRIAQELRDIVLELDDSRAITAAMHAGFFEVDSAAAALDVRGMNYATNQYNNIECEKVILGTENGPVYATRGIYSTDKEKHFYDNYGRTCASFGQPIEDTIEALVGCSNVAGVFVWCGFDYRGEPQPYEWPSVGSHWGLMDTCGFEKDIYYLMKAYYDDVPFVHLLPHWNHTVGEKVQVCVYSNCQRVKVYLNEKLIDEKTVERGRAEFEVVFAPGVLRAEGFADNDVFEDKVITSGNICRVNYEEITSDNREWIINVWAVDKNENFVPNANNKVEITTERGVVVGCSNGNPTEHTGDTSNAIELFSGRCQFIMHTDPDEKPVYSLSIVQ